MRHALVIIPCLISLGLSAQDLPNHKFEERLQNTYEELKDQRVSKQQWDVLTAERDVDVYEIQPGDNLWDVSKTIFGSGFFWPKLWQLNAGLTNPHEIEPGASLSFIDMGISAPPLMQTEMGEINPPLADIPEEDKLELSEDELLELSWKEPELPPGKAAPKNVGYIPPSFYDWRDIDAQIPDVAKPENQEAEIVKKRQYLVQYFFRDKPVVGEGKILESELGYTSTAAAYEYVFVEIKAAGVGDEFVAVRNLDPLLTAERKELPGAPVEVQAKLKIVETVDPEKNIHKAIILKSFEPVSRDSVLMAGDIPRSTWGIEGNYLDIKANIVGGRFDSTRNLLGFSSIIYLDKGRAQGIQKGALLNILKNNALRGVEHSVKDAPSIGRVKIIDVDENVSTGVIVESKQQILSGDFTGNPVSLQVYQ